MPWITKGPAGGGQARRLDGVGVEQPAGVGVVGPAVAALIGDAQAHDVVARGRDAQPGFARGQAVQRRRRANSGRADRVEAVPHANRGHGLGVGGRSGFILRLRDHE